VARQKQLKKSDIEKMEKLRNTGYIYSDIARLFKVSETTVRYHLNPYYKGLILKGTRERRRTPEGRKQQNEYYKGRYKTDEEFRKRHIERTKRYQREHPEQHKQNNKAYMERIEQKKSHFHNLTITLMMLIAIMLIVVLGLIAYYRWFILGI